MFTGIVEEVGTVDSIQPSDKSIRLALRTNVCGRDLQTGDSLAVNGCCLTVINVVGDTKTKTAQFDLLRETWQRTNLQFLRIGSGVNLERALRADGRLGGHFVTGHIDGIGRIDRWEREGEDWVLDITPSAELMRYIVFKGAVAIDGISLTVAAVRKKSFRIWIIPHTYEVTALRERKAGDAINIEADILGKYVEKLLEAKRSRK